MPARKVDTNKKNTDAAENKGPELDGRLLSLAQLDRSEHVLTKQHQPRNPCANMQPIHSLARHLENDPVHQEVCRLLGTLCGYAFQHITEFRKLFTNLLEAMPTQSQQLAKVL